MFEDGYAWSISAKSPETEEIERRVREFLLIGNEFYPSRPWIIRKVKGGRARLMIMMVRQVPMIPAQDDVRIVLVDGAAHVIADKTIQTGNRFYAANVTFQPKEHGFPCVIVDCHYVMMDELTKRQWIAVRDNEITLVRLVFSESSNLGLARWRKDMHQLGPEYRFPNHSAWSQALKSSDEIDILEALLHLPPQEVIEKRDSADIKRLTELSCSTNAWIREGASAALAEFNPIVK